MTGRARRLRSPALRQLPFALAVAVVVEIGLRTVRLPVLARALGVPLVLTAAASERHGPIPAESDSDRARVRAGRAVMRHWPIDRDVRCLRTALLVGYLIRHRRPELRIGVTRQSDQFRAHAWLVLDGTPMDLEAAEFTLLQGVGTE